MSPALTCMLVAFLGYSVQNVSQATQKLGLRIFTRNRPAGAVVWALATMGTTASVLIILYAVSIGDVSLVGAMAGTGLLSLTLYSRLVLGEPVGRREVTGVLLILGAATLLGTFAGEPSRDVVLVDRLLVYLAAVVVLYTVLWLLARGNSRLLAITIGGFAGALGGFVAQFQKVSALQVGAETCFWPGLGGPLAALCNPYTLAWIALTMTAMLVLQFAHRTGAAIRVIPAFSANYISIPVLGGIFCFGESFHPAQWLGLALILAGVFSITRRPKPLPPPDATRLRRSARGAPAP